MKSSPFLTLFSIFLFGHSAFAAPPAPSIFEQHTFTKGTESSTVLPIKITSEGRCMIGDLDIIGKEIGHSHGSKLLLSIEPIPGGRKLFEPVVQTITLSQLTKGFKTSLTLPIGVSSSAQFGIFICKDSSDARHCSTKGRSDLNELYKIYKKPESHDQRASDKVYFFQYVSLQQQSITFLNKAKPSGEEWDEFHKKLTTNLPWGFSRADAVHISEYVSDMQRTLASKPLRLTDDTIIVNVPHIDPSKCS